MKKISLISLAILISTLVFAQTKNFHDFKMETIDGDEISLSKFKGKKLLVVNVASKCGLTSQYEGLEALYKKYGGDNFEIIAFPANDFLSQEPGTNMEIKAFCTQEFGVTFTMMSKISVKGDNIHPLYQWLTKKSENGVEDSKVAWNFQKYLIDENGKLIKHLSPKTKPMDDKIVNWIKGL